MLGEYSNAQRRAQAAIFLAWLLAVTALTFSVRYTGLGNISTILALAGEYPPIRSGGFFQSGLMHASGLIHLAAMFLAVCGGGWPLAAWMGLRGSNGSGPALKIAFGWGVVSMLGQGLGLAGILHAPVLLGVTVLLSVMATAKLWRKVSWSRWDLSAVPKLPVSIIIVVAAGLFIQTRLPDTFEDSMLYHFAAPEQWLMLHKIIAEPQNAFWNIPLACETVYVFPWHFGGIEMAKLVNYGMLLTTLGLVLRIFRILVPGSRRFGWWACLWLASAYIWIDFCWQGKNDMGAVLFFTAASLCAVKAIDANPRYIFVLGWFLGGALAAKMTAIFSVAGLFLGYLAMRWKSDPMRIAGLIASAALIPLAGWLLQSWIFVGNPLYPFFSDIFPSLYWGPEYLKGVQDCMAIFADPRTGRAAEVLAGAWSVFGDAGSVALIALLPLAFLVGSGRAGLCLKLGMGIAYLLWIFTERNGRYLAPLLPLGAALGACAMARLGDRYPLWIRNANRFLAAACLVFFGMRLLERADPSAWHYLVGKVNRADFMQRRYTTWEKTRRWVNANIPPSSRMVALCEPRRLWFNCRIASHAPVYQPLFWRLTLEGFTPGQVRKRLRQLGYSHCLFNFITAFYRGALWFSGPEWSSRQLTLYEDFMAAYGRVVYISGAADNLNGGFYVYAYLPQPAAKPMPVHYLPSSEGMLARASRLMNAGGRPWEIDREFARLRMLMPRAMYWRELMSVYLWERGDFEGIRTLLGPVLEAGYFGETAARVHAGAALNLDKFQLAIDGLTQAWKVNNMPEVAYILGLAYLGRARQRAEAGNWEGALKDAGVALLLVKDQPKKALSQMDAAYKSRAREEARKMARRAVKAKLNPPAARALAALDWIIGGAEGSGSAGRKE